jgi:hypothetical protein
MTSKYAPLMPRHVTPDNVIDLKLHTHDACLTVSVCVKFKVITKNFTTDIFIKSILTSFQPAARGRYCNL